EIAACTAKRTIIWSHSRVMYLPRYKAYMPQIIQTSREIGLDVARYAACENFMSRKIDTAQYRKGRRSAAA
ncbi:hypothetical protein, partial [uncultured Campylobacter sp.]|uniref:hypothetical protein n=1 Tax=uncultured Campylobacter sp. TaxID=218934 RepID=UPI0026151A07